jgi:hypothetical protein
MNLSRNLHEFAPTESQSARPARKDPCHCDSHDQSKLMAYSWVRPWNTN